MDLEVTIRDTQKGHKLLLKDVIGFSYENIVGFTKLRVYFWTDIDNSKRYEVVTYSPVMAFQSVLPD